MGEVVDIMTMRPHQAGLARCLACKNEWPAVAPVGTTTLNCPECDCDGHFVGEILTDGDQWQCRCGYILFRMDRIGLYCAHCGHRGWGCYPYE